MGLQKNTAIFGGGRQEVFLISLKLFCNFIEIALRHGCSPVNLLHIFRISFPRNTSGRLLLKIPNCATVSHCRKICEQESNHVRTKY